MAGISVSFAAATGGGSVAPTSASTGADGKATTTRTLGPGAGTQTTTATVTGVTPASFSSTATIQGAVTIAVSGSASRVDTVNATVAPPLTVLVKDQNGAPVPGVIVDWSATGGGLLSQAKDTTDAAGIASVTWRFFIVSGTETAQAAVTGLVGSPIVFTGTVNAGNATQVASSHGDFEAAPVNGAVVLSVVVKDALGNGAQGVTVNWAAVGGGSVGQPTSNTDAQGIASMARILGSTSGAYGTTATVGSLSGSPVTFSDTAAAVTGIAVGSGGNIFNPATAIVTHGDFVIFTWGGGVTHNVVWDTGPAAGKPSDSPSMSSGSYLVRLTDIGSYTYHCSFHGGVGVGMHGSIDAN